MADTSTNAVKDKDNNQFILQTEWIKLINEGCRDHSKSTALKYLEFVGQIMGYNNIAGHGLEIKFSTDFDESSETSWSSALEGYTAVVED